MANPILTALGWLTNENSISRLRVEEGTEGFYDGREFRMYVEFNIPVGGELWVKHVITNNFVLHDQRITLVKQGELRWSAVAGTATSPGPWTAATSRRRNQMTSQPQPMFTSGSIMQTSSQTGAATGGFEVDVQHLVVEKDSASTIQNAGKRGLAAGTYHARLQNLGTTAAVGVYDWWWEERP